MLAVMMKITFKLGSVTNSFSVDKNYIKKKFVHKNGNITKKCIVHDRLKRRAARGLPISQGFFKLII